MDSPSTIAWQAEPDFRGTFTILTSCISTLLICTWSALHADIPHGKSTIMQYTGKGGWFIIGLLAPELLLFTAFNQYVTARRITKAARTYLSSPEGRPSRPRWSAIRGVMSEVLYWRDVEAQDTATDELPDKSSPIPPRRKHQWTVTHSFYAVMGGFVLQDPHTAAQDPYLPSWQCKGVLTPEGVEFLMRHSPTMIPDIPLAELRDRNKTNGLAKALLVTTIAHAVCALLTYGFWWSKPKDVKQPMAVVSDGERAQKLGAWMSTNSCAQRSVVGGMITFVIDPESRFLVPYAEHRQLEALQGRVSDIRIAHYLDHFLLNSRNGSYGMRSLPHPSSTWKVKYIFHHTYPLPWYIDGSCPTPEEQKITITRLSLALDASDWQYLKLRLGRRAPLVIPVAHLQASTYGASSGRTIIAVVILTAAYGLPHLIGWSGHFATVVERRIWQVATVLVMVIGVVLIFILTVVFVMVKLIDTLLDVDIDITLEDARNAALGIIMVAYFSSSAYLVAESFRQLSALPPEVFALPSWGNYWPHFA